MRRHKGEPQKTSFPLRIYFVPLLLLVSLSRVPAAKAQGDCNTIFDADDKMLSTDHRSFSTRSSAKPGANSETNESVSVAGVIYINVKGVWHKSPMTVAQLRQQKAENRKDAKNVSCHYVRDESVNGEAARVFSAHSENEDDKSDATVWISKSRGLPLRQEQDIDTGGDAAGKMHYSVRYEYTNVSAPPVH